MPTATGGWRGTMRAAVAAAFAALPALSEPLACPDPRVAVEAGSPALHDRVCGLVEGARTRLAECGLGQGAPLTVRVVEDRAFMPHSAPCLGLYDCTHEEIRVLHPGLLTEALGPDDPLALLPADELFDSLITHELAHAFFAQTAVGGGLQPIANQEYVAYVMQLAALSDSARATLLDVHPGPEPIERIELNEVIALAAPTLFAVKAWRHFTHPENGCAFVEELIRGEVSLSLDPI